MTLKITDEETIYVTPQEQWVCDFCHGRPVACRFPCPNFTIDVIMGGDGEIARHGQTWTGDWFACPRCQVLVLARDREGLVRYVLARNPMLMELPRDFAEALTRTTYESFFGLHGDPVPTNTRGVELKRGAAVPLPPNRAQRRHPKRKGETHARNAG